MRKYIILFFLVFPFLFSCSSGTPDGIINPDEMTNLLTEIHIADGSLLNMQQTPDTLYKYGTGRYMEIFKRYHTDSTQFRKSFRYYTTEPTEFITMYDQVIKNLQDKTDSVNKILAKQNTATPRGKLSPGAMPGPYTPSTPPAGMPPRPGVMPPRPVQAHVVPSNPATPPVHGLNKAKQDSLIKQFKKTHHALPQK